jgi:hypothetical protein
MSENEKNAFAAVAEGANNLAKKAGEETLLAITQVYLAGKEAGIKAAQAANKPDTE